jgi:hypothetical protein
MSSSPRRFRNNTSLENLYSTSSGTLQPSALSCLVCPEEAEEGQSGYCKAHTRAYNNLKQAHKAWIMGYGTLPLLDFLKRVEKVHETGEKTKEVVRFIIENPSRWT